ncbi:MAG: hypothetical protein V1880_00100 [Patescibacteria group bacterium]
MPFEEAFNVVPKGKETKLEVNVNAFKSGNEFAETAKARLEEIQSRLDFMQKHLKKDLNTAELRMANLAIEKELEDSIPDSFSKEYFDANTSWPEAAALIAGKILTNVNHFIGEKVSNDLTGTGDLQVKSRLRKVVDIVDSESWTGDVSKSEAGDIYTALEKSRRRTPTPEAVTAFMDRYSSPSLLEKGGRAIAGGSPGRRAADEAMGAH